MRFSAKAAGASARAWARILSRVFEVDPLICSKCAERMLPVAAIIEDEAIVRVLGHMGLSADFPKLLPARSPPEGFDAADPTDGVDPPSPEDDVQLTSDDQSGT